MSLSIESFIARAVVNLKADSHELCLMHADAADSCVSAEIGIFQFFCTAHFCQSRMCQNAALVNHPLMHSYSLK